MTESINKNYPESWLDDFDDGGGEFEPLPDDVYNFELSQFDIKTSKKGLAMARFEVTVINDNDGYDGRKVWTNGMLECTYVDKDGNTRSMLTITLLPLIKAIDVENPGFAVDVGAPPYMGENFIAEIPKDDQGNIETEALLTIENYLNELMLKTFHAKTKTSPRTYVNDKGKTVETVDTDIAWYRTRKVNE